MQFPWTNIVFLRTKVIFPTRRRTPDRLNHDDCKEIVFFNRMSLDLVLGFYSRNIARWKKHPPTLRTHVLFVSPHALSRLKS